MYTNEHAARLVALNQKVSSISLDIQNSSLDMQWFAAFDAEHVSAEVTRCNRVTLSIKQRLNLLTAQIQASSQLKIVRMGTAGGFLANLWRSSEQKVAQHQVAELDKRLAILTQSRSEAHAELTRHEPEEQRLSADLRRYRTFNPLEAQATIVGCNEELIHLQQLIEDTRNASERWDAMAGEVSREWQLQQRQLAKIENDIGTAQDFEQALSSAQSSREKAQIHKACALHFDNSKPGLVLSELTKKRRKLERDVLKLEERLQDIARLLDRHVDALVLDGNNLCYSPTENGQSRFVGLAVLNALVPHLCQTYKVTLIFDPGIRSRLSMNDAGLRALFPEATVLVMRSGAKADEGILAAAEFDQGIYIVSNDRFADYPEKRAVKERRLLSHIIHPHSVQIQQLQINIPY